MNAKPSVNLDTVFATLNQASQDWAAAMAGPPGASNPLAGYAQAWFGMLRSLPLNPAQWLEHSQQVYAEQLQQWASAAAPAAKEDRRFSAPEWAQYPLFDYIRQSYLMTSKALMDAAQSANLDPAAKKQMLFVTRQFVDAMSPANYALTNPEVLKLAVETRGENFSRGLVNLAADLKKGQISLSDDKAFAVGENLANAPGAVVYENELIQLIQYAPSTDKVSEIPILIVSSIVNKYYLMDLAPASSLVRYLVAQGHTVLMVSWRSISPELGHLTWDDYVELGVLRAIEATRKITAQKQLHGVGYCTGGALLSCALAVLATRNERPAVSLTLLMTLLDSTDPGEIGVYLDRNYMAQQERQFANGGVVSGKELTAAFSSLRANDLVWSFVINNYLKGTTPDAFDLFYWNADDTNLAGPMFSYYLRQCYLENNLIKPGAMSVLGVPIDLGKIDVPSYVFAALNDHLVPWKTSYESVNHLGSDIQFVLGGGGHITGPINPVAKNKRNYWVDGRTGKNAATWLASARSVDGSWWPHWNAWLEQRGGKKIRARSSLGSKAYPPIEAAPGRYAKMRLP